MGARAQEAGGQGEGAGHSGTPMLRRYAKLCSDVGLVVVDGVFECSFAIAARQIVSERW